MAFLSSGSGWTFVWLAQAAVSGFFLARWLRGRPCARCEVCVRTRYLVHRDGFSPEPCCIDCLTEAEYASMLTSP